MEGENRYQSDHAFGDAHGGFSEDLVLFNFRVTLLINSARDPLYLTALDGASDRLCADAGLTQFMSMHHAARFE